jgi:hypothetical protein
MTLVIKANQETKLKLATGQSKDLRPEQILVMPPGQEMTVLAHRAVDGHHLFCTFAGGYGAEKRNSWYIYQPHWDGFATGKLFATFAPLGMQDEYGGELFNLHLEMDGDRLDIECGSGQPGHVPIPVGQDWAGSMNPICQGLYLIENPIIEDVASCDPAIGPVWMALTPKSETNGRGGFLIHMDYNWQRSPGTAGCIFPLRNRNIYTIADWVKRSSEAVLSVEYGF